MRKALRVLVLLSTLLSFSCRAAESPRPSDSEIQPAPIDENTGASATASFGVETPGNKNIRFEQFNLEEGLSQSVVNAILQDRMGFLWIGTEDGLNRYDGYHFRVYKPDPADPASLSDRWIKCLAEDPQGYLWIGTRLGGLNRYDPMTGKFIRFLHDDADPASLVSNMITALLADREGLWIGTDQGLDYYEYGSGTITHFAGGQNDPAALSGKPISAIYKDGRGTLWIGTTSAGLIEIPATDRAIRHHLYDENDSTSLSHNRVFSIEEDAKGMLWIGTANGLNRFEAAGGYFTRYLNTRDDPDLIGGNSIYAIYSDRSGGLWLGTNRGLDRYDPDTRMFVHHRHQPTIRNSLSYDIVYSIFEDRSGVLWVGTYGGGLNKYNRQQDQFGYYRNDPQEADSLADNFVFPILVDSQGIVWIGTQHGGLNRFDPETESFTHFLHDPSDPNSLDSNHIVSLSSDLAGNLWVGTSRGLVRFDPRQGTFERHQPDSAAADSLAAAPVYVSFEDNRGKIWVGTPRGLDILDPVTGTFTHHLSEPEDPAGFSGNAVMDILEDGRGSFWVATFDDGLKRFSRWSDRVIQYQNDPEDPASLTSNSIFCLFQDSKGSLWIGTGGGGLNLYDPVTDSFVSYTEEDGLPNNVVYGILEDEYGDLWLSTNFGLSRFNPSSGTFRNFTVSDGLQSNEFDQNAYARDAQGNLYFGGINGFNVFDPQDIRLDTVPPPVVLTSVSLDGVPLGREATAEGLQEVVLTWPQDSFEFEFAALDFGQPAENQYSYMLEDFDSDWILNGTQRTGRYTNLPGGSYTLRLRGSNSDGTWNEAGASIRVTVIPPFWETWWFLALLTLIAAVSIAGGLRWRVKSIESRNRELERLVRKRTADLEKRTREIEALYQADEKILRNVTLIQVFQTLVDVSVSMLKADRSVIFVGHGEPRAIVPRVSQGFRSDSLAALTFDEEEEFFGHALRSGEPVIIQDLRLGDLRGDIRTVLRAEGIQSLAHFPIVLDGQVVAVFDVGYTRPNAISEDHVRLFSALVNRAVLSIANMQLFEQTKDLAVMEERNRLARDLHDSAKQKAFAALAQLGTARGMSRNGGSENIQPHLNEAENLVYEVIQELTFLIQEIYPIALQEKGLLTTLREYVFEWENRNDILVNLQVREERPLPLETEQAIYRVIQEALANVARHSRATHVDISVVYNYDSLQVMIADNGCGFDMDQKARGMGFRSMHERIGSIRGTLQVQSAPGRGTCVIVQIPIKVLAGVEKA